MKKIRRQYFTIPLTIMYSFMIAIPYAIFIISLGIRKFEPSEWPSTFWTSVWVIFVFSLPLLLLKSLNKHCFGRVICVIDKDSLCYPKGKIRWQTIEKIEYILDSHLRYPSDSGKTFRTIIYTKGGKHIVLDKSPLHIISYIKKYNKEVPVRISGLASLLRSALFIAVIILLCPIYVAILCRAPGASLVKIAVCMGIFILFSIIRDPLFDAHDIQYRFWRRILPVKWLSYIVLGIYYSSFFVAFLVISYFPNWFVIILTGIYLGIVQPPIPSKNGSGRFRRILSYEQLCEVMKLREGKDSKDSEESLKE